MLVYLYDISKNNFDKNEITTTLNVSIIVWLTVDVPSYCMVHKTAILPDLKTCAKYFNCSDYGGAHVECRYPDLFSTKEKKCVNFTSVKCDSRPEPQAPCKNLTFEICEFVVILNMHYIKKTIIHKWFTCEITSLYTSK